MTTIDEGEITFQEYFVRRQHDVAVTAVRFDGAADATPAPGVLATLEAADRIVIAPSNPVVSIDPVPGPAESGASSMMVFHSPQASHRPDHLDEVAPQAVQLKEAVLPMTR